jgi:UDP-N-acetylmuramoylalanine--D-glutamate ligase
MDLRGRNAVVLGLGLTGFSLARHLAANGASVRVADTRAAPPFAARLQPRLPAGELAPGRFQRLVSLPLGRLQCLDLGDHGPQSRRQR